MNVAAPSLDKHFDDDTLADFARSPLVAFYEVTQACDLVCAHCRACAQARPDPGELATVEAYSLLKQLSEFPLSPMLVLSGGDPLKRADIYLLVEHATRCGLSVSVTPVATPLATRTALHRLKDAGVARVALSLDGADRDTHDRFRGIRGSFQRTLEIIESAQSIEIPVQVNSTITPENYRQVDEMADLLAAPRIDLWSVFFLVPVGRGNTLSRILPQDYEWVFERLWLNAQRHSIAIKSTEAPHYRRFVKLNLKRRARLPNDQGTWPKAFPSRGVNDGKGVMFIGHTGLIYPSGFMPITCGRFPQQQVVDVYQHAPLMRALRDPKLLQGKCGRCEFRAMCGGSRARSFAVTGNAFAEEPDCVYQPRKKDWVDRGTRDTRAEPRI